MSLFRLFVIFSKIGAILLGGGYVIFPILEHEFIEKRALIDSETLVDFYAISQTLPGLIAANISMFIGYKLAGKGGAIAAMLGIIFVPFICIVLLASILGMLLENKFVQGILWGIGIAVIALIILTIREMWQKSTKDIFFYSIFLISLVALIIFKLSPIQLILSMSLIGLLYKAILKRSSKQ